MTTTATKSYYELEEGQKVPLMYYAKKNIMRTNIIFSLYIGTFNLIFFS